jgi:hypothetical protein
LGNSDSSVGTLINIENQNNTLGTDVNVERIGENMAKGAKNVLASSGYKF